MAESEASIKSFLEKANEHSKKMGRMYDLVHKQPNYVMYRLKDEFVIFDGEKESRLTRDVVYGVGKDQYLIFNHRNIRDAIEGFDYTTLSDPQLVVALSYAPRWMSEAANMALNETARMNLEKLGVRSVEEMMEKMKEDKDFAIEVSNIIGENFDKLMRPLPLTIEERQKEERARDREIMKGFGLEKYLYQE